MSNKSRMIDIETVYKTFNRGKPNEVAALSGIDLFIDKGEFVVIVGSNGSGKSTLLNIIAGSIFPTSGGIKINGIDVGAVPDYNRSKWIAHVFQNPLSGTAPDLSILDNFRLAALRTQKKGLKIGVNALFSEQVKAKIRTLGMGLENKTEQPMGTLSGGQRQALTLLMCVMADCKILLLDEPTAALDPRSADMVMKTADKLVKDLGITAVLITHNLKDAYTYGSRVIQMAEGKILKDLATEKKSVLKQTDLFEWFA